MWNNLSKALGDSLNLAKVVGGNERAAFERLHLSENFKRARGDLDLPLLRLAALEHGESPGAVGA